MNVRDSAALVIATLAESKPNSFKRDQPLLQHMQEVVFPLIQNSNESAAGVAFDNNPAWRIDDEDNDDNDPYDPLADQKTATSIAQGMLDTLACELPPKNIFSNQLYKCVSNDYRLLRNNNIRPESPVWE